MQTYTVEKPPEAEIARNAFDTLQGLQVGESIKFSPALSEETTNILYSLMRGVDKGWLITAPPTLKRGFFRDWIAQMNQPVDMGGRSIPQSIAEIKRTR